jgi:hypothetical protein
LADVEGVVEAPNPACTVEPVAGAAARVSVTVLMFWPPLTSVFEMSLTVVPLTVMFP